MCVCVLAVMNNYDLSDIHEQGVWLPWSPTSLYTYQVSTSTQKVCVITTIMMLYSMSFIVYNDAIDIA